METKFLTYRFCMYTWCVLLCQQWFCGIVGCCTLYTSIQLLICHRSLLELTSYLVLTQLTDLSLFQASCIEGEEEDLPNYIFQDRCSHMRKWHCMAYSNQPRIHQIGRSNGHLFPFEQMFSSQYWGFDYGRPISSCLKSSKNLVVIQEDNAGSHTDYWCSGTSKPAINMIMMWNHESVCVTGFYTLSEPF